MKPKQYIDMQHIVRKAHIYLNKQQQGLPQNGQWIYYMIRGISLKVKHFQTIELMSAKADKGYKNE